MVRKLYKKHNMAGAAAAAVAIPAPIASPNKFWNKLTTFGKFLVALAVFTAIWIMRMLAEKGFEVVEATSSTSDALASTAAGTIGAKAATDAAKPRALLRFLRGSS